MDTGCLENGSKRDACRWNRGVGGGDLHNQDMGISYFVSVMK